MDLRLSLAFSPLFLIFPAMDPFLQRCLEIAARPGAIVEPNPLVGAVVVHGERIIGEGWHRRYGGPHAEVNAIQDVRERHLLPHSTIYVSLEPCNHHGKTPPCTGLILQSGIPKVVIGSLDPNSKMAGRSVQMLRDAGVEVVVNEEDAPFIELNRHFWHNQNTGLPYVTLKWAESADGFIAARASDGSFVPSTISSPIASRWVHWQRHEHQAILIGKGTALSDDPALTTRKWPGEDPVRIVFDRHLELPMDLKLFREGRVVVINGERDEQDGSLRYFKPADEAWGNLKVLLRDLYSRAEIGSILVEGGAQVHAQFLEQACCDRIHQNIGRSLLGDGLQAVRIPPSYVLKESFSLGGDVINVLVPPQ